MEIQETAKSERMVWLCPQDTQFLCGHFSKRIDTVLNLNGVLTFGTVLFYIANEGLSITGNSARIGGKIPSTITDRLQTIENEKEQSKNNADKAAG